MSVTPFAQRVLDGLGPALAERGGDLFDNLVDALTGPAADVDALVVLTEDGWAQVFDLDTTPAPGVLAAVAGTRLPGGLTLAEQRDYIRRRPSWRRGSVGTVLASAQSAVPGRRVDLFERVGSPWHLQVRVTGGADDVATTSAVQTAVAKQKPVGITFEVLITAGATYQHMLTEHGPTYAGFSAAFASYATAAEHVPEEGTTP